MNIWEASFLPTLPFIILTFIVCKVFLHSVESFHYRKIIFGKKTLFKYVLVDITDLTMVFTVTFNELKKMRLQISGKKKIGGFMYQATMYTISEAAGNLGVSEALIRKFIMLGLITPVNDGYAAKLTSYHFRRLTRIVDLYEKSYSPESIESILNYGSNA